MPAAPLVQSIVRRTRARFAVAALALATALPASAAPIAFDNAFGTGGKVFANVVRGPSDDEARAVVVQADGKTVMAGACKTGLYTAYCLVRYDSAGNLDPAFGQGGIVVAALGGGNAVARALALDGTKIVVAGSCGTEADRDFCIARYLADGTLDTSFNASGIAITPIGGASDDAWAVAMDGTRILVAGECEADGGIKFCLARYLTGGTLDPAYGVGGKVLAGFRRTATAPRDMARALVVSDGKALVAGGCAEYTFQYLCVARFDADGLLDSGFGYLGMTASDLGTWNAGVVASAIALSGSRILVVGACTNGANLDFCMLRVSGVDGSIDTTLAGTGYVRIAVGAGDDAPTGVALVGSTTMLSGYCDAGGLKRFCLTALTEAGGVPVAFNSGVPLIDTFGASDNLASALAVSGSLVTLAGACGPANTRDFCIARYSVYGERDIAFNLTGLRVLDLAVAGGMDGLAQLVRQPDGKLLAAGTCFFASSQLCLARFNADGSIDAAFGDFGVVVPTLDPGEAYVGRVALDSQNRILLAGACNGGATLCVTRYLATGAKDTSFGVSGTTFVIMGTGITISGVAGVSAGAADSVVVGAQCQVPPGVDDFCWLKLTSSGGLDSAFGTAGRAYAGATPSAHAFAMAADASGFMIAGSCIEGSPTAKFCVARVTAAGQPDAAFGAGNGRVAHAMGDAGAVANAMAIQSGKIVLGGYCQQGASQDFCLARLLADGSLDATFSGDGRAAIPVGAYVDEVHALLPDGTGIIAAGSCSVEPIGFDYDLCLARFLADGSVDAGFNDTGTYSAALGSGPSRAMALVRDGNRVIAGAECVNPASGGQDFCLAAFALLSNDFPRAPAVTGVLAGDAQATVAFTPPADPGASPITQYTASCGTQSASGPASPLTVANLVNGVAVGCTVTATNGTGTGPASDPPVSVTPRKVVTVTLTASANPTTAGTYVTLTATVLGQAPTGQVEFREGASLVPGCGGTLASGVSPCTTNQIPAGAHSITVHYPGDAANTAGDSAPLALSVIAPGTNLTVLKAGLGQGTVTSSPAGIACGATCLAAFANGAQVTLTAVAAPGSTLLNITGCDSTVGNQCTLAMTGARSVQATFLPLQVALTVSKTGTGSGTVTAAAAGIDCGPTCSANVAYGSLVAVTQAAAPGSTFSGWGGACSGTGACQVSMDAARTVTASFAAPAGVNLTITKSGNGTLTSSPAGIACGATCVAAFAAGTQVTLTVVPDPGFYLLAMGGCDTQTGDQCTVTMTGARSVSATFLAPLKYLLTVAKTGTGSGRVISQPDAIDCGSSCAALVYNGTAVTLAHAADAGSMFSGWSGACTGTGTCQLTMDAVRDVTASFTLAPPGSLSVSQSATPSPAGAGKDVVYPIAVTNTGSGTISGVTLVDSVPAGTQFIWASPGCANAAGTVTCGLGALASGAGAAVTVVVRPAAAGSIANNVVASGSGAGANTYSSLVTTVNATPPGTPVLRYRLYSDVTKEHHFTTDQNEYNVLGTYVGTWVQEGTVGRVLNNPGSFNSVAAVPYYRLYDTSTRWHHWTTDANEYYTLAQYPSWNAEGVDGYILPSATAGATQLYRLNYPYLGSLHHWTIDANEYSTLIGSYGWVGEGGSGFVIQ